jgi:hypothetical protein
MIINLEELELGGKKVLIRQASLCLNPALLLHIVSGPYSPSYTSVNVFNFTSFLYY